MNETTPTAPTMRSLKGATRRSVQASGTEPVTFGFLPETPSTPVVIRPAGTGVDLPGWLRAHAEVVDARLLQHGAVLLRGFHGGSVEKFEQAASALCSTLFREYGDLPREGESDQVYKSTPYPQDLSILFHNESSHLPDWPMRQFFSCIVAPQSGGQTPIVDCRTVLARMRPELAEQFATRKLRYVRNFIDGVDVSWSRFFGTEDRAEVERRCAEEGTDFEWTPEGGLRTSRQAEAVLRHPVTGEAVFFNQLALHHPSALDPETRASLLEICGEQGMPRNVFWGDGTTIDDAVVTEVRDLMDRTAAAFSWQEGDVLVIDNMLVAHSRSPFTGPRKIVVALGDMISRSVPAVADVQLGRAVSRGSMTADSGVDRGRTLSRGPVAADSGVDAEITERLRRIVPAESAATGDLVLLTGASGFVGSFILADLLARGRRVACLLRGGERRRADVIQRLDGLGLWRDHYAGRLDIVAGDLADPSRMGIDRPAYDELASQAGAIVHCAAWVNHVCPYDLLAPANAHSAAAILELAVAKYRKPVTFVSSSGVFAPSHYPVGVELAAEALTALPEEQDGYGRSKGVAEAYFARAAEVGASVSVVRIPKVFGGRDAHHVQDDDAIWSWTKAILLTGHYPSSYDRPGNELFQALPADVVARIIVEAERPSGEPGCRFVNAVPNLVCSSRNFIAGIREAGYEVEALADRDWYQEVSKLDPEQVWVAALAGEAASTPGVESPQRQHRFSLDDDPEVSELVNAAAVWTPKDIAGFVRSLSQRV